MKLKTLLLGSAAAMIAFTGARAADAVVAEPEPVEYVRVCDAYGNGFFYIPGTETCLQISGYVQVDYEYTARNDGFNSITGVRTARGSTGDALYTGRVNFDARSETDYGTLRSYIRVESQGGNNTTTGDAFMRDVFIELGGLAMGYRSNDYSVGGHSNMVLDNNDSFQRDYFGSYTYASSGFAATVGLQVDDASGVAGIQNGVFTLLPASAANKAGRSIDPYLRASYAGSIFTLTGSVAYDSSAEETAYGARIDLRPIDGLSIWAWYEGESGLTDIAAHEDFYGVGASYGITDTITAAIGYSYADNSHVGGLTGGVPSTINNLPGDITRYNAALTWNIAPGFQMRADYERREADSPIVGVRDLEDDQFRVRFQRSF